ncbi:DUF2637 domain-containing protein [Nocardia aurantiaca]|uniref:DUF2637 domain-containing protein n=1 Tax=Nocardia aurantiaca TaxID=2675850 RepID=UPI0018AB8EEA|nr:DUF2637 domain-containing protein [Nocardia aurantiaca]
MADLPRKRQKPRAADLETLTELRTQPKLWAAGEKVDDVPAHTSGPKPNRCVLDVADVELGTGPRPGEALALRWCDHAVLYAPTKPAIAAAIAIVPPIALLAAVHSVAVLARAHTTARLTHISATALTILIALAAFRLSFTALRALAISAAVPTSESWLFPIIVEGTMTQATISLLAFAHSGLRRHPAPLSLDSPTRGTDAESKPPHRSSDSAHDTERHPSSVHTPDTSDPDVRSWAQMAEVICNGDPAHRRDSRLVANVLIRHFTDGRTPTQIAREINLSRSAISRIIGHATELLPAESRAHIHRKQAIPARPH